MRCDVPEACCVGCLVEFFAYGVVGELFSMVGEQDVCGAPVRGWIMGRPAERVVVMRSTRVRTLSSTGIMRSELSLPRGTLSQDPCPGISWMQSSSRSSSSPMRSPHARCTSSASAASR